VSSRAPNPSRRARREAERRGGKSAALPIRRGLSPIAWLTGGAVMLGLAIVAVLVLANRPAEALALLPPGDPTPVELADGRALGRSDAPATLDVYEDYQCPGCAVYSTAMEPRLIREYVAPGRLRIVFRDFAFLGQESLDAAAAARAAGNQGAFWAYHDWLFANQSGENRGAFRREVLVEIARRIGLDVARFERDLDDPSTADAVSAERDSGSSVPVTSTPTLVLNGQVIEGGLAWETLAAAIDAATAPAPSASPAP